ncbi:MAG: DUF2378 family protein [Deltaproteobacteria bacterium]|nr:DUF2378 family protein [Deltaproteobacteria bacterium]
MAERYTTTLDEPLRGDVDLERCLAEIPKGHVLKGMFFRRYADADDGPPSSRYHAFEDYPMADYLRLFDRAARRRFPGSTREAYRLLARGEVEVFASSMLGKVTFSLLREPGAALIRYPETFGILARGPTAHAKRLGERSVEVVYPHYDGALEYAVGVLEGIVLNFEERPSLDVTLDDQRVATLVVSW